MSETIHIEMNGELPPKITLTNPSQSSLEAMKAFFLNDKPKKSKAGFVYAITDGRYVKIGKADNVDKRLSELQTGHPNQLTVLAQGKYINAGVSEKLFHRCYRRFKTNVKREWFDLPNVTLRQVVYLIRRAELPERDDDIKWEGLITPCPQCSGRSYKGGWCLDCGCKVSPDQKSFHHEG